MAERYYSERWLTALPVFNEVRHVNHVLDQVRSYGEHVLVVDDGSTDGTSELLAQRNDIYRIHHAANQGYGAALLSAFKFAQENGFEGIVTIDCDGQHEPKRIPRFIAACRKVDIVSGSRYLKQYPGDSTPPPQRLWINQQVTAEINRRLGLQLTDAFCGFKAYRVAALRQLNLQESGYAMPLEFWVQAAHQRLKIIELPVPLIYLDEKRSFGAVLDNAATRLEYYHQVIDRSLAAIGQDFARCAEPSRCGEGM